MDDKKVKKVMQFRQKVQAQVRKTKAKHGSKVKRVWRHEDVVHQPKAPVVGAFDLVAALAYLFRKRTALRPEINPARPSVSHPTACCISVTVQRAHNLPRRRPGAGDGTAGAPSPLEVLVEAHPRRRHLEDPRNPHKHSQLVWGKGQRERKKSPRQRKKRPFPYLRLR